MATRGLDLSGSLGLMRLPAWLTCSPPATHQLVAWLLLKAGVWGLCSTLPLNLDTWARGVQTKAVLGIVWASC